MYKRKTGARDRRECTVEWHSFVNRDELKGYIHIPVRSFSLEARETAPGQLLATARTLASEEFLGRQKLETSFESGFKWRGPPAAPRRRPAT